MLNNIEQGTIIYGIRSKKYSECANYAVIISARCDIANNKISKMYYLTAVDAVSWFTTEHGFHVVYNDRINSAKNKLVQGIKEYRLNAELLLEMSIEDGKKVIDSVEPKIKKRISLYELYEKTYRMINEGSDCEYKKQIIRDDKEPIVKFLDNITRGVMNHYFYIPKNAYLKDSVMHEGIIIDLQEIGILELEDARRIVTPGIDYKIMAEIEDETERARLMDAYWLNDDTCFVAIEATIQSPWCELLMQRFSNDFIRIGVDGANRGDFMKLAEII